MSESSRRPTDSSAGAPATPAQPHPKKKYVKPAFVREAVFETTALACGKIGTGTFQCSLVQKSS